MHYPIHPLAEKVASPSTCKLRRSFVAWTDLLGFGSPFAKANWAPDPQVWQSQAQRIGAAFRTQCQHIYLSVQNDTLMLLLNDGMVRALSWSPAHQASDLSRWLHAAVFAHHSLRKREHAAGLPGPRTVLSAGWIAEHSFDEVRADDMVFDYTRAEGNASMLVQKTGNPVLVSNSAELQLNTAFSRAFLLDEAGSRAGLAGSNLYVDEAFLDAISEEFAVPGTQVNVWEREHDRIFSLECLDKSLAPISSDEIPTMDAWRARQPAIDARIRAGGEAFPSRRQPWPLGFLFRKSAINVDLPNLKTTVRLVQGYFPYDEDPRDFVLEL